MQCFALKPATTRVYGWLNRFRSEQVLIGTLFAPLTSFLAYAILRRFLSEKRTTSVNHEVLCNHKNLKYSVFAVICVYAVPVYSERITITVNGSFSERPRQSINPFMQWIKRDGDQRDLYRSAQKEFQKEFLCVRVCGWRPLALPGYLINVWHF